MTTNTNTFHITQSRLGNPGPLGLSCFGLTTVLLNMKNAHWIEAKGSTAMVLGMAVIFGGFGQLVAGVQEFIKGNTFGATAFAGYGCFWISWSIMTLLPNAYGVLAVTADAKAAYLFTWGVYSTMMAISCFQKRRNWTITFVFTTVALLFLLLACSDLIAYKEGAEDDNAIGFEKAGGYVGLAAGYAAMYLGQAEMHGWPVFERPALAKRGMVCESPMAGATTAGHAGSLPLLSEKNSVMLPGGVGGAPAPSVLGTDTPAPSDHVFVEMAQKKPK